MPPRRVLKRKPAAAVGPAARAAARAAAVVPAAEVPAVAPAMVPVDEPQPVTPIRKNSVAGLSPNAQSADKPNKKLKSDDTKAKGHCKTTLNQWCQSNNDMLAAKGRELMKQYNSFSGEMQASFARKVLESKSSKDFSWTRNFAQTLSKEEEERAGCKEDYYTRPQILEMKGMKLSDFESVEDALKAADEIIADQRNTIDFSKALAENPDKISGVSPLANQYWFAKSLGRTSTWKTNRNRTLSMETTLNSKHMTAIQSDQGEPMKLLQDVLGEDGNKVLMDSKDVVVKNEYPIIREIDKVLESLESPYQS